MRKDRIINIRFLFYIFVGLMLGILVSKFFLMQEIGVMVLVLSFVLMAGVMACGIIYAQKTKDFNMANRYRRNVTFVLKSSSIGIFVAFCVGVLVMLSPVLKVLAIQTYSDKVVLSGVISEYVDTEETYNKFILKDCSVASGESIESIEYNVLVYSSTYLDVDLGSRITFSCGLDKYDVLDSFGFSQLGSNIAYSTYASTSNVIVEKGNISVRESIHRYVKDILDTNLNEDNSNISFAVLFGQKYSLSKDISQMFSYAGISHILAVSGLHIGVLVSVLWVLLNKIKINRYAKLVVFALILGFYSYLCMFSPSVCRASIMALVMASCRLFKIEYDSLSSLSIAGIIILLANPLSLFSISFQLSFLCIFSIISLSPAISYVLKKIHLPKLLNDSLAISIATNIVILPVCMNAFAEVSLLGVIANVFVLPIFSLAYILLFGVTLFACIIKPLGVLLCVPNLFMHIIKTIANWISQIPFGVFKVFNISYLSLFLMLLVSLVIHFVISKHWIKGVSVGIFASIICVMVVFAVIPKTYYGERLIITNQYNTNICIYIKDNEVSLIGSDISKKYLDFITKDIRINKIDNIIAYDLQLNELKELNNVCNTYNVKNLFIPNLYNYPELFDKLKSEKLIKDINSVIDLKVDTIENKNEIIGIKMYCGFGNVLIPNIENNKKENNILLESHFDVDFIVVKSSEYWESLQVATDKIIFIDKVDEVVLK